MVDKFKRNSIDGEYWIYMRNKLVKNNRSFSSSFFLFFFVRCKYNRSYWVEIFKLMIAFYIVWLEIKPTLYLWALYIYSMVIINYTLTNNSKIDKPRESSPFDLRERIVRFLPYHLNYSLFSNKHHSCIINWITWFPILGLPRERNSRGEKLSWDLV